MSTPPSRNQALMAIALTLMSTAAGAETLTGLVANIADGDTLTLVVGRQHHNIRIAAIDAPERYQAWGNQSKTNLSRLAINRTATAHCTGVDRSGRQLCTVNVNAMDIGLQQIRDGMAWWLREDADLLSAEDQSAYAQAEFMAKLRRTGLWRETHPVPPWSFRKGG